MVAALGFSQKKIRLDLEDPLLEPILKQSLMDQKKLMPIVSAIKFVSSILVLLLIPNCRSERNYFSYDAQKSLFIGLSMSPVRGSISKIFIYTTTGGLSDYLTDNERLRITPIIINDQNKISDLIKCIRSSCNPVIVESPDKSQKIISHIIIMTIDSPTPAYIRFIRDSSNRRIGHIETWHGSDSYYRNSEIGSFLDLIQNM